MNELVTLITPTGSRQESFKLLEGYIARQTYKGPLEWIVVDDCTPRTPVSMGQKYLRGPRDWTPDYNTQRGNMEVAMEHIRGDYIFIIEDDDWYHPRYIETYLTALKTSSIVGSANAKYYSLHVPGWKEMHNYENASLCQTAFTRDVLPLCKQAVGSGELFFDIQLWKYTKEKQLSAAMLWENKLTVGLKGMPGRTGIGIGHTRIRDFYLDSNLTKLREWIGDDANKYLPYIKGYKNANTQSKTSSLREGYRSMLQSGGKQA